MSKNKNIAADGSVLDPHPPSILKEVVFNIPKGQNTDRVDKFLSKQIENATRTKVQRAVDTGNVLINGKPAKASYKIQPGDNIVIRFPKSPPIELVPQNIPLDIKYEDEYLLVVNKEAGICTHPGVGNRYGTLVNALLYYFGLRESIQIQTLENDEDDIENDEDDLEINKDSLLFDEGKLYSSEIMRPGVVHRLDKDTSGLILIIK